MFYRFGNTYYSHTDSGETEIYLSVRDMDDSFSAYLKDFFFIGKLLRQMVNKGYGVKEDGRVYIEIPHYGTCKCPAIPNYYSLLFSIER